MALQKEFVYLRARTRMIIIIIINTTPPAAPAATAIIPDDSGTYGRKKTHAHTHTHARMHARTRVTARTHARTYAHPYTRKQTHIIQASIQGIHHTDITFNSFHTADREVDREYHYSIKDKSSTFSVFTVFIENKMQREITQGNINIIWAAVSENEP